MVEWFKAAVLKTAEGQLSEGSNPSSSAIFLQKCWINWMKWRQSHKSIFAKKMAKVAAKLLFHAFAIAHCRSSGNRKSSSLKRRSLFFTSSQNSRKALLLWETEFQVLFAKKRKSWWSAKDDQKRCAFVLLLFAFCNAYAGSNAWQTAILIDYNFNSHSVYKVVFCLRVTATFDFFRTILRLSISLNPRPMVPLYTAFPVQAPFVIVPHFDIPSGLSTFPDWSRLDADPVYKLHCTVFKSAEFSKNVPDWSSGNALNA